MTTKTINYPDLIRLLLKDLSKQQIRILADLLKKKVEANRNEFTTVSEIEGGMSMKIDVDSCMIKSWNDVKKEVAFLNQYEIVK